MNKNYVFQNASERTEKENPAWKERAEETGNENANAEKTDQTEAIKREHLKEYLSYLGLALSLFAMNTLLLSTVVEVLGINAYLAKIITEILLFILSYFVQKHLVFSNQENVMLLNENTPHNENIPFRNEYTA